jgi:hypothetical protein
LVSLLQWQGFCGTFVAQCSVEGINESLHGRSVISQSHCVVVTCDMLVLSVDHDSAHLV